MGVVNPGPREDGDPWWAGLREDQVVRLRRDLATLKRRLRSGDLSRHLMR
jgi:hypothetical protein